jgi:RND family efflux transporter MFP subunit
VAINVAEQDIRYFEKGMAVDVSYWAEPNLASHGQVREISGAADAPSRTFSVRVSVGNDPKIRLGQTATVTAQVPLAKEAPIVPLAALDKRDGHVVVWIVDQTSETVASRGVETGAPSKDGVRITKGLAPGEMIVVAGTQFLTDGLKVKLTGSKLASAADFTAILP